MSDELWADPVVRYCDDGVEYARGPPKELASQIKALKEAGAKLISAIEEEMVLGWDDEESYKMLEPSDALGAAIAKLRDLTR